MSCIPENCSTKLINVKCNDKFLWETPSLPEREWQYNFNRNIEENTYCMIVPFVDANETESVVCEKQIGELTELDIDWFLVFQHFQQYHGDQF
jgi:hypothetical protein